MSVSALLGGGKRDPAGAGGRGAAIPYTKSNRTRAGPAIFACHSGGAVGHGPPPPPPRPTFPPRPCEDSPMHRHALAALRLCGLICTTTPAGNGDKPAPDIKAADKQLDRALVVVINRGAELYNAGDQAGCAGMFEAALLT